jgi:ketosteroid isomerase-like protein
MSHQKIAFVLLFISTTTLVSSQSTSNAEVKNIQQTITGFFEALSNRDSSWLKSYCTADIILYENGSTWNADSLIRQAITLNTGSDFSRKNHFDFVNTGISAKTAWASYHLRSEVTRNGKHFSIHWLETVILIKEHKQWKIKVLHSTLVSRQ